MTREDIIRMAREVGIDPESDTLCNYDGWVDTLVDFAALVTAHVRETEFKPDWNNYRQGLADGAAAEREACAKAAEEFLTQGRSPLGRSVGEAIRARGQV